MKDLVVKTSGVIKVRCTDEPASIDGEKYILELKLSDKIKDFTIFGLRWTLYKNSIMWPFTCEKTVFVAKIHNNSLELDVTPTFENIITGSFKKNTGRKFSHHIYTNVTIEFSPFVIDSNRVTIWDTQFGDNYKYKFDRIHLFPMGKILREKERK